MKRLFVASALIASLSPVAGAEPAAAAPLIRFRDASASSGIAFVHSDGSAGDRHIVETVASGLALIDFDGDGDMDVYFLNGGTPQRDFSSARSTTCELYRNDGDGRFTNVTDGSGLGIGSLALGCAVADYDNDGREDVFVTGHGRHFLMRNLGSGRFSDVTERAGLMGAASGPDCVGAGCAFLDFDRDGFLDLYVGNYLHFDAAAFKPCVRASVPVYCDPRTYAPAASRLFRNNGDGTFRDVTEASGIGRHKGYAMGIVCSDFDGDGWTDIYVGNDVQGNYLFHNRGDGTFKETGALAGVAYDQYGDEQGTMGVNAGDYDGDGRFDILVTAYQNQPNTLYRNLGASGGALQFEDVTVETGAGAGSLPLVTWGCGFGDFDNDGVREMFVAAGHLQDTIERYDNSSTYKQRNQLFQWRAGRFSDIASKAGSALDVVESSRGSVLGDLNNDGRLDGVVLNARARPTVMINDTASKNHWVILKLVGTRSNRSAVGAVVRLTAGNRTQIDEVRAGRSYQSAEDLRLHFGLGDQRVIDRIEVRWPGGVAEVRTNVIADRVIRLTEGESSSAMP